MSTAAMTAETPAAKEASPAKPKRPKMRGRNKLLLIIGSLVMMGIFRTGFMFIIIGLMPTIVAYYVDVSRRRYTFKTIFACNLSGMMPFIGKMLSYGPSSTIMADIMGDASNWFMIYGSALIGWLLVKITPLIAHTMIGGFHGTQIARLKGNQKRIETEWGPEVTQFSTKEEDEDDGFWGR